MGWEKSSAVTGTTGTGFRCLGTLRSKVPRGDSAGRSRGHQCPPRICFGCAWSTTPIDRWTWPTRCRERDVWPARTVAILILNLLRWACGSKMEKRLVRPLRKARLPHRHHPGQSRGSISWIIRLGEYSVKTEGGCGAAVRALAGRWRPSCRRGSRANPDGTPDNRVGGRRYLCSGHLLGGVAGRHRRDHVCHPPGRKREGQSRAQPRWRFVDRFLVQILSADSSNALLGIRGNEDGARFSGNRAEVTDGRDASYGDWGAQAADLQV